ncbi:hypothetical protein [Clostridium thailandense]|uniref:hypothetical protein n=1 Tax=Clostridium thailandense TaxID=2794346 RepID=UPI003988E1FB
MEDKNIFKGLFMTVTVLEDRLRIDQNDGYLKKHLEESYDEILFEDIDLNHIECAMARSVIIRGCFTIPLNRKVTFNNVFKGKSKEIKIWFGKDGNEPFEKLRELLMAMR